MTKSPTPEQALSAYAAAQKTLAQVRLPMLQAVSARVGEVDPVALSADLAAVAALMPEGATKTNFENLAKIAKTLPTHVAAALAQAQSQAGVDA